VVELRAPRGHIGRRAPSPPVERESDDDVRGLVRLEVEVVFKSSGGIPGVIARDGRGGSIPLNRKSRHVPLIEFRRSEPEGIVIGTIVSALTSRKPSAYLMLSMRQAHPVPVETLPRGIDLKRTHGDEEFPFPSVRFASSDIVDPQKRFPGTPAAVPCIVRTQPSLLVHVTCGNGMYRSRSAWEVVTSFHVTSRLSM